MGSQLFFLNWQNHRLLRLQGFFQRLVGSALRPSSCSGLLIEDCWAVHTFWGARLARIYFLDDQFEILLTVRPRPFHFFVHKGAKHVVEIFE